MPCRILFVADLHDVRSLLPALVLAERGADLCLVGGDITNFGGASAARTALAPLRAAFPQVRAVMGNVDRPEVARFLVDEGLSLHGRGEEICGLWISGVGGSNHTPLRGPTEVSEETLAELLEKGMPPSGEQASGEQASGEQASGEQASGEQASGDLPWILVTHVPPRDTVADRMFTGRHVGSTALRAFLEAGGASDPRGQGDPRHPHPPRRPALHLCGHIHEGVGKDRVGLTEVCNPGAFTSRCYARVLVENGTMWVERRQLQVPRGLALRATVTMMVSKVAGYARHRLLS